MGQIRSTQADRLFASHVPRCQTGAVASTAAACESSTTNLGLRGEAIGPDNVARGSSALRPRGGISQNHHSAIISVVVGTTLLVDEKRVVDAAGVLAAAKSETI